MEITLRVKESLSLLEKIPLFRTSTDLLASLPKSAMESSVDEFGNTLLHHFSLSSLPPSALRVALKMKVDVNAVNADGGGRRERMGVCV